MTIRHATLDDLEEITKLEAKCFPAAEAAGREDQEPIDCTQLQG